MHSQQLLVLFSIIAALVCMLIFALAYILDELGRTKKVLKQRNTDLEKVRRNGLRLTQELQDLSVKMEKSVASVEKVLAENQNLEPNSLTQEPIEISRFGGVIRFYRSRGRRPRRHQD